MLKITFHVCSHIIAVNATEKSTRDPVQLRVITINTNNN
ncbi:MAG: hypothetical protein H6Q26_291 [Bacteroidetes bacterium]|nr:hypothetical protein [Bacteroidota bacterium]